jgi:alpha-tubulin suppressor-like RCC1 family protein
LLLQGNASLTNPLLFEWDSCVPKRVPFFNARRVQQVVCGARHTTVKSGAELFAWGYNENGQLGNAFCLYFCLLSNDLSYFI